MNFWKQTLIIHKNDHQKEDMVEDQYKIVPKKIMNKIKNKS